MNMVPSEVKPFVEELRANLPRQKTCDTVICAPFPLLTTVAKSVKDSRIAIGAQNVSEYTKGAYTGETSLAMLQDIGVRYVIIGHSERRAAFGETDYIINTKAKNILRAGMNPIICVGESLEQRERELTLEHITYQVKAALYGVLPEQMRHVVIAYEPIWAIGTGRTASTGQAQEVCEAIRTVLRRKYGARVARGTSILYGGSMKADNAQELLAMPDIDGGLIGGASLDAKEFSKIILATGQEL
jgi:triosephosphate isomerase